MLFGLVFHMKVCACQMTGTCKFDYKYQSSDPC